MSWCFLGLSEPEMSISEADIRGDKRFFDIFVLLDSVPGGVRFLRRVAQSKAEFKGLLLSYSEHETDISNYLNEHDQVGRISEKSRFEFKKIYFFRKIQNFQDFEMYLDIF